MMVIYVPVKFDSIGQTVLELRVRKHVDKQTDSFPLRALRLKISLRTVAAA